MTNVLDKLKSAVGQSLARSYVPGSDDKLVPGSAPSGQKRVAANTSANAKVAGDNRAPAAPVYLQEYNPPSKPTANRWTEPLEVIFKNSPKAASLEKFNRIYKVEQLVGYLDKEKGVDSVREKLAGILSVTEIHADTLVEDGKLRQEILKQYLVNSYKEMDARADDLERQIDAAEKLINSAESELTLIETRRSDIIKTVEGEAKHIDELLSFLCVTPVEKEKPEKRA